MSGSESSIVFSGGSAGIPTTLLNMIANMNKPHQISSKSDSFVFDTSIFKTIPQLYSDFKVPYLFTDWDNDQKKKRGLSWNVLSLGPSRTGQK